MIDPACGSGGMFVSSADFIEQYGANANMAMTFYGQEKVEYNAKLCLMNMAVCIFRRAKATCTEK